MGRAEQGGLLILPTGSTVISSQAAFAVLHQYLCLVRLLLHLCTNADSSGTFLICGGARGWLEFLSKAV